MTCQENSFKWHVLDHSSVITAQASQLSNHSSARIASRYCFREHQAYRWPSVSNITVASVACVVEHHSFHRLRQTSQSLSSASHVTIPIVCVTRHYSYRLRHTPLFLSSVSHATISIVCVTRHYSYIVCVTRYYSYRLRQTSQWFFNRVR